MRDHKLRKFLGVKENGGYFSSSTGMLAHLRARIESLEKYLGVEYESSPSVKGFPRHIKLEE